MTLRPASCSAGVGGKMARLRFSEVEESANCSELRPWRLSALEFLRPVFAVEGGELGDTDESSGEL